MAHAEPSCACTGVRWCSRCKDPALRTARGMHPPLELPSFLGSRSSIPHLEELPGVVVVPCLLSEAESLRILEDIESAPFLPAQSGKLKQHFGAKVNFNARKVRTEGFVGLPAYAALIQSRLRQYLPQSYETTDLFVLRYHPELESNLDFHVDDDFAYGDSLIAVSLESDSVLTFLSETELSKLKDARRCARIPLRARSAVIISGEARYRWSHGILAEDIEAQRTSITMRTVSPALEKMEEGRRILSIVRQQRTRSAEVDGQFPRPSVG